MIEDESLSRSKPLRPGIFALPCIDAGTERLRVLEAMDEVAEIERDLGAIRPFERGKSGSIVNYRVSKQDFRDKAAQMSFRA